MPQVITQHVDYGAFSVGASQWAAMTTFRINRAPVLTLWAAVVAEQIGLSHETALTAGQAVAGMTAHAKGVRLGIYGETGNGNPKPAPAKPYGATGIVKNFLLLGRIVHIADTRERPRGINKGGLGNPAASGAMWRRVAAFGQN